jgi:hypothetical protein
MFTGGCSFVSAFFLVSLGRNVYNMKILITACFTLLCCASAISQKQLVLLRGEKVLLRLRPGDEFIYKLKNSKTIKKSYVNNLFDFAVMTHRDTIPFDKIDRIYFRRSTRINVIGGSLVFAGGLLFLIDQVNYSAIQGHELSLDAGVTRASLAGIIVGLPMMLIKKKSQKITYKYRLFTARKGSPFFEVDPRGYATPYIDN